MLAKWMRLPVEASAHAPQVDAMIVSVHWLIAAIALVFGVFFVVALVRFNRKAHPRARHRNVSPRIAAIAVTVITAVELWQLCFVAIPLWASRVSNIPSGPDTTIIRVVAQQYAWNVHYPGPDGRFGRTSVNLMTRFNPIGLDRTDPLGKDDIVTINEFYFPVGKPVLVQLTSKDMIHSFTLPQMRVKQDAIPGMLIPVWFLPTVATPEGETWEINCSQLCGLGHYGMRGIYRSMTPDAFRQFLDDEAAALKAQS